MDAHVVIHKGLALEASELVLHQNRHMRVDCCWKMIHLLSVHRSWNFWRFLWTYHRVTLHLCCLSFWSLAETLWQGVCKSKDYKLRSAIFPASGTCTDLHLHLPHICVISEIGQHACKLCLKQWWWCNANSRSPVSLSLSLYIYICIYVSEYDIHVLLHISVLIYIYTNIYIYIDICIYIYIYTYIHTLIPLRARHVTRHPINNLPMDSLQASRRQRY